MEKLYSYVISDTMTISERKIYQRLFFTILCFIPFGMLRLLIQAKGLRFVLPEMILLFSVYLFVLLLVFRFKRQIHLCHWLLVVVCVSSSCLFSLSSKLKKNLKQNFLNFFFFENSCSVSNASRFHLLGSCAATYDASFSPNSVDASHWGFYSFCIEFLNYLRILFFGFLILDRSTNFARS